MTITSMSFGYSGPSFYVHDETKSDEVRAEIKETSTVVSIRNSRGNLRLELRNDVWQEIIGALKEANASRVSTLSGPPDMSGLPSL